MDLRSLPLISILFPIENVLKGLFLVMSIFNLPYTLIVAFLASLIGLLRVCKTPQFSKQYLARAFLNNHGQNLLYISFGSMGYTNYLYYSPIAIFFAYGIAQYINIKMPQSTFAQYTAIARNNKMIIMQGKAKLQIAFFLYVLVSLPFDFMGRLIKVFLMGQYLLIRYKVSGQFRLSCTSINQFVLTKTSFNQTINSAYCKLIDYIYNYANKDNIPQGQ